MAIEFSKKMNLIKKIYSLITRKKLLKIIKHINFPDCSKIIEEKKYLKFVSYDGFETQVGKKIFWYSDQNDKNNSKSILQIGKASYLQNCTIGSFGKNKYVQIGSFCSFGPNVELNLEGVRGIKEFTSYPIQLIDENSNLYKKSINESNDFFIKIGNDVFIGENVKIMRNVTIGNGVIIGARSLVPSNKVLEPYGIYVGSPVKLVKYRFDKEIIDILDSLKWWEWSKNKLIDSGIQNIDFSDHKLNILKKLEGIDND